MYSAQIYRYFISGLGESVEFELEPGVWGTKMKMKIIVAAMALLALPGSAFSQVIVVPAGASNSDSASSWVAGGQAGYNWQHGPWVYGLEADISAMRLKSEMSTSLPVVLGIPTPSNANTSANIDWYGTLRGRLGWATGPLLFYGTGGLAYGRVELNSSISSPVGPRFLNSQASDLKAGWVAGAGIEYMWRPNVILNLGYQYVDLGTISAAGVNTDFSGLLTQNATAHAHFTVVTAGISWRFAPSDAAGRGLWEGLYAGGHVGGAWGNRTTADYFDRPPVPSDVRLKRDVTLLARREDGLGLYRYRYLWSDTVYVGVMAQEVAFVDPDAVVQGPDGYLRVYYSRLGLKLMTEAEWADHQRL
jgi:outer membrane immunogenic protein